MGERSGSGRRGKSFSTSTTTLSLNSFFTQGEILFEIVFLGIRHTKYLGQRTLFPALKPRCFPTCAVPSYDEDSSNSDWCGLQLKHVTRPEWPGSCRKDSVRGAERGLGPDEWPDCKQDKHISYQNDKWEYVFKLKSLILKIYTIHGKFYVFLSRELCG